LGLIEGVVGLWRREGECCGDFFGLFAIFEKFKIFWRNLERDLMDWRKSL
jgi:hypothetical protein